MSGSDFARAAVRLTSPAVLMCALAGLLALAPARGARAQRIFGVPFDLRVGESTFVGDGGLQIGFITVPYDGRCPVDEICYVQGNAIVHIWADDPVRKRTGFALHTMRGNPRRVAYGNYHIRLLEIVPRPRSGTVTDPDDYVLTLVVKVEHHIGCGMLIRSDDCVLYADDFGGYFILDNHEGYKPGNYVRVVGIVDAGCLTFCRDAQGCIINNMITRCGSSAPAEESTWGRIKSLYR